MISPFKKPMQRRHLIAVIGVTAMATAVVTGLLVNIFEKKDEAEIPFVRLVEVTENDTDPQKWGINWPREYDGYKKTATRTSTRFGGHGGSEAMPPEKIERDPWLKRMFSGYSFSIDYRDRRGHAYMLEDQEKTLRQTRPQSGSCLHCHASIMPLYRKMGNGDAMRGMEESYKYSYQEMNKMLRDMGHANPVSCVDCHDPATMQLRVTRPGFISGIRRLVDSGKPVPYLPSIEKWRKGDHKIQYDPNNHASRAEMRSMVCGQCHVEYYCSDKQPLTFPWGEGLKVEEIESFWNNAGFLDGTSFYDYEHEESGARLLKAQHPEFELWSQGIHARSGVSCADCHMPYIIDGAARIADHWVRSPLLNISRSCLPCHKFSEEIIKNRVDLVQDLNHQLLQQAAAALMDQLDAIEKAKKEGATNDHLKKTRELQRKAQWRLDFIASENSMGFHASQEAARILSQAGDYARQGQVAAITWRETGK